MGVGSSFLPLCLGGVYIVRTCRIEKSELPASYTMFSDMHGRYDALDVDGLLGKSVDSRVGLEHPVSYSPELAGRVS